MQLINPDAMGRHGLAEGDIVTLFGDAGDHVRRNLGGLTVTQFGLPGSCLGGYYPEMNPLIPLWDHDEAAKTAASKGVPVRIERAIQTA